MVIDLKHPAHRLLSVIGMLRRIVHFAFAILHLKSLIFEPGFIGIVEFINPMIMI